MGDSWLDTKRLYARLLPSSLATGVFVLAALPQSYGLVSSLTGQRSSCPTLSSRLIHMLLYFAVLYAVNVFAERYKDAAAQASYGLLAKYTFYCTLLFFVLTSPESFNMTGNLLSGLTDGPACPSVKGVLIHAVVYLLVLTLVLYFPRDMPETEQFRRQ